MKSSKEQLLDDLTRKGTLDSKTDRQDGHQSLVGHGINDCPNYGLKIPSSGNVAIYKIGDSRVCKQSYGPSMMIMEDEVTDDGCGDKTRECQYVG